jgi:signal transduction histidine kinase
VIDEMPKVDACSLHLCDNKTQELQCKGHRMREGAKREESPVFSRAILNMVLKERKAVLTSDALNDDRLGATQSIIALNIRSAMCVPLQSRNRLFGMLQAGVLLSGHLLTEDDLRLLAAIGMQAGTAFENATLYEQLAAEKAALQQAHEKLRTAQDTLVRSEKLAAVGRLSAGIVHDVKNPMTVILCHVEMLMQMMTGAANAPVDNNSAIESLKQIEAGVLQCNSVMNGLLQFARQANVEKAEVSPNTLIEEIVRFLAYEIKKAKATVNTDLKSDVPPIFADAGQIKQVLLNLLVNAMQAINEGGRITITTGVVEGAPGAMVFIRIRDTGCGMSPEVQSHLFEPFFTSKTLGEGVGGMGLGLSISYGIIKNHNGSIEVESAVGQGTAFTIKLSAHR